MKVMHKVGLPTKFIYDSTITNINPNDFQGDVEHKDLLSLNKNGLYRIKILNIKIYLFIENNNRYIEQFRVGELDVPTTQAYTIVDFLWS